MMDGEKKTCETTNLGEATMAQWILDPAIQLSTLKVFEHVTVPQ